jgi:O-antigen biosynthesis protein WbqP
MFKNSPEVATHLLQSAENYLTPFGSFLRKTSLDELPQLWSVLKGYMSFVGPRPALFNQDDLIQLRTERKISKLTPGITGWAQINGRDDISIPAKVSYDEYYLQNQSFFFDLKILWYTFFKVIKKEGVVH